MTENATQLTYEKGKLSQAQWPNPSTAIPALLDAKAGGSLKDQEFEISLANMVKTHLY